MFVSLIRVQKNILFIFFVPTFSSKSISSRSIEAQENCEDAQNLITRLQTERETFEMRSRHLEEELALAKGEMLRLRRQISASKSQKTRYVPRTSSSTETSTAPRASSPTETSNVPRTSVPTETSQTPNEQSVNDGTQKIGEIAAETPYTVRVKARRGKGGASR